MKDLNAVSITNTTSAMIREAVKTIAALCVSCDHEGHVVLCASSS